MKIIDSLARAPVVDFLIPASLDPNQALRLRRFGLAALTYFLGAALMSGSGSAILAVMRLSFSALLDVAAAWCAINLALYVAIRSGFNLRFKDPSLTRFQILAAITALMYLAYSLDNGVRDITLFGCALI